MDEQGHVRCVPFRAGSQSHGAPGLYVNLAEHEANAKWPRVRTPSIETKQHVKPYIQSVADEPFLNRVSQVRISSRCSTTTSEVSARQRPRRSWRSCWPTPRRPSA